MAGRVPVGGVELAFDRREGTGDPVVIVPGAWGDRRGWGAVARGLAAVGLDLLTYDRRGHGESSGAVGSSPVRDDASDLAQLLERVDLRPVHLLAGGTAGGIVLRLAYDRPELVRSLVFHDPPFLDLLGRPPEEERLRAAFRQMGDDGAAAPAGAARAYLRLVDADPGAWDSLGPADRTAAIEGASRWGPELRDPETFRADVESLPSLGLPVLVTTGEHSAPFFGRALEALGRSVPVIASATIPETGHLPQVLEPERYVGVLTTFLLERNVPPT